MMLSQMMISAIYGHDLAPAVLADEKGNVVRVERAASPEWLERLLRPVRASSHMCNRKTALLQHHGNAASEAAQPRRQEYMLPGCQECCTMRTMLH